MIARHKLSGNRGASFEYEVINDQYILINDLSSPDSFSVTNQIESIIEFLNKATNQVGALPIIYCDSYGFYTGIETRNKAFHDFVCVDRETLESVLEEMRTDKIL